MKIECIVTSYNYGDYLYYTLPSLVRSFDKVLVVTGEDDLETIMACKRNNIEPIIIDPHVDGAVFKKGYMIDKVLKEHVEHKDWIILTDADIFFEEGIRDKLEKNITSQTCLYGAYRRHAPSFQDFVKYIYDKKVSDEWPRGEERFLIKKQAVLGFFQLTKYDSIPRFSKGFSLEDGENMYPDTSGRASHDDFYFQRCRKKKFLPIDVIHLSERKTNWNGRVTDRFDVLPKGFFDDRIVFHAENINDISNICDVEEGFIVGKYEEIEGVEEVAKSKNIRIGISELNEEKIWWTLV